MGGRGRTQFGVRKAIVAHKSFISYQQTPFPGVDAGISVSFQSQKAEIYDVISPKIEQNFVLFQFYANNFSCAKFGTN